MNRYSVQYKAYDNTFSKVLGVFDNEREANEHFDERDGNRLWMSLNSKFGRLSLYVHSQQGGKREIRGAVIDRRGADERD